MGLESERLLHRLIDPETPFVLVDPTEIPRPKAKHTRYVGRLKDGKLGFMAFTLAQPYQGRAIPVCGGVYSEATLNEEGGNRNLAWRSFVWEALRYVEPETVWVFDREFSFAGWLEDLEEAGVRYVVRLAAKQKAYLEDKERRKLPLLVPRGGRVVREGARYRVGDSVSEVNVVGVWEPGHREPLWVMGNLPMGELLEIYKQRMKIEEAFRDLKEYLRMESVMSKTLENAEKTLRLLALAYALGLVVGETMRREWRKRGAGGGNGGTTQVSSFS